MRKLVANVSATEAETADFQSNHFSRTLGRVVGLFMMPRENKQPEAMPRKCHVLAGGSQSPRIVSPI
jgi:hypothetical protein